MIIKYFTALVFVAAIGCSLGVSQSRTVRQSSRETAEKEITQLERERFNAYLRLDARTLERIMSSDYTSVYADGQIVTRANELAAIKSAPRGVLSSFSATIGEISVRQFGRSAVLVGRVTLKGKVEWPQKPITVNATFRYSAFYVKTVNRWQVVGSQFTRIDESAEK